MSNRFSEVYDVHALIHQIVGAGSMCWENAWKANDYEEIEAVDLGTVMVPTGFGEFDMNEASKIADEGFEQLCKIASGLIGDMAADAQGHISEVLDSLGISEKV